MDNLTTNQALAIGGIVGGMFAVIGIFLLVFYIITVIAFWKIFTKAGEAGWKSLIPIYNVYILYKISGISFWLWLIVPALISGVFTSLAGDGSSSMSSLWSFLSGVVMIVADAKFAKALASAFGRGNGFAVGLFFFPNIFELILGFGSSKYVGPTEN